MTKRFDFNWQIPVPECLLNGGTFDRWTEEKDNTELEPACVFKVDEYGFFIYWKSEGKVGNCLFDWCAVCHFNLNLLSAFCIGGRCDRVVPSQ